MGKLTTSEVLLSYAKADGLVDGNKDNVLDKSDLEKLRDKRNIEIRFHNSETDKYLPVDQIKFSGAEMIPQIDKASTEKLYPEFSFEHNLKKYEKYPYYGAMAGYALGSFAGSPTLAGSVALGVGGGVVGAGVGTIIATVKAKNDTPAMTTDGKGKIFGTNVRNK